jgi:hypothetical protein
MRSTREKRRRAFSRSMWLVLFSSVLAAVSVDASATPGGHTGAESSHETTRATNVIPGDDSRHPASLQLTIHAFGANIEIDLERNDELFSPDYRVLAWNPASNAHQLVGNHPGTDHCHYRGRVRNANPGVRSRVVLSTCHGLSGILQIGDETITLKPSERDAEHRLDADVVATIDTNADGSFGPIPVGEVLGESSQRPPEFSPLDSRRALLGGGGGGADAFEYTAGPQTIVMRMLVINDNDRCKFFTAGASMTSAEQTKMEVQTRHIMNMVAWTYETISDEVSFRIVLAGQVNWCAGNPFSMNAYALGDHSGKYDESIQYYQTNRGTSIIDPVDLEEKLQAWIYSNQASLPPFDVFHVFTPNIFQNAGGDLELASGFANMDRPCYAMGVDGGMNIDNDQIDLHVTAHELGHNFGLDHDIGPGCHESDIYHIMSGAGSDSSEGKKQVRVFSTCSVDAMLKLLQDGKLDCLKGPGHRSTTGRCGNGIIDPGEVCDCGALDCSSVDACCDGTTCQLATGATCARTEIGAGGDESVESPRSCCDAATCAPVAAGTVCRAAVDATCDAPEVCDGTSSSCPADVPAVALGTPCAGINGDRGSCWGRLGQQGPFRCSNRDLSCTSLTDSGLYGLGWTNPPRGGAHAAAGTCSFGDHWQRNGFPYDPAAEKFTAAHCDGGGTGKMVCFSGTDCSAWWHDGLDGSYALAGFPCGDIGPDGIYESVCDGGSGHDRHRHLAIDFQDGYNYDGSNQPQWYPSKCVPTSSLLKPPPPPPPSPPTALPPFPPPFPPPAPFATTTLFVDVTNFDNADSSGRWNWIWHIEGSLAAALPQSYGERYSNDRDSSTSWTRATFSLKARMTIPGIATVDGVSDAAFTRAVAADLGVDVDTVVIVNKALHSRRRRARALLSSGGVTVDYELSNYATVANTRSDPDGWGSVNANMTRELYVRNRVLESAAFANVNAAFGASPDVSDPPANPMSATCELFIMAGSVEEAAAVLAKAEEPGFPAEVNAYIRSWHPTQTAIVTKVSATPETYHPPPEEDGISDGMIALYVCIAIVACGLAAGAAYRWGGALRRKLANAKVAPASTKAPKSTGAKKAPASTKAAKSSTAKVAPAPPKGAK